MMSVGLWVGALAFCLMYPLTTYKGKLKSGFAWWASKASILYPVAILQGLLLIILLHVFNGFTPIEMTKTVLFACLTAMAFTSIMYFFNITFGKVGSFLMLVFMVIQLAGFRWYLSGRNFSGICIQNPLLCTIYLYSKCIQKYNCRRHKYPSVSLCTDRIDRSIYSAYNPAV